MNLEVAQCLSQEKTISNFLSRVSSPVPFLQGKLALFRVNYDRSPATANLGADKMAL